MPAEPLLVAEGFGMWISTYPSQRSHRRHFANSPAVAFEEDVLEYVWRDDHIEAPVAVKFELYDISNPDIDIAPSRESLPCKLDAPRAHIDGQDAAGGSN